MTLGVLNSVLLYTLLKVVNRGLALTVLVLDVISNAVSSSGSILLFAPLMLESAYAISLGLFSGSCLLTGYLIFRSTFLPRTIGVLLALAGICYLLNTVVVLSPKGFADYLFPWIFLPILVCEGVLALWLLIAGVNSAQWDAIARQTT